MMTLEFYCMSCKKKFTREANVVAIKGINRKYYCISCKKNFNRESQKHVRQKCEYCHSEVYVREVTKFPKQPINYQKALHTMSVHLKHANLKLEKRKFQLAFEHNLVEAMKKFVPTKEAFVDCLKLAKVETASKKRTLLQTLKRHNMIKREDDIGFEFRGVKY